MKQSIFTHSNRFNDDIAVLVPLHAFVVRITKTLWNWKKRDTLSKHHSRMLAETYSSDKQPISQIQQSLLEGLVKPAQIETERSDNDAYHMPRAGNAESVIPNRESLSENFNSEIDAWAKQALAANGFGDY